MRELDRHTTDADLPARCAVVGCGRLGPAMAGALRDAGLEVDGPLERGADHELLAPLVRATVENWAAQGAQRALTGPLARGDEATVASQREAVAARAPELLELFEALVDATRALAAEEVPA